MLIDRMDWLIETLLKLSSMDAGTITFHQTETSVKELLSTAAAPLLIPLELREGFFFFYGFTMDGGSPWKYLKELHGAHAFRW